MLLTGLFWENDLKTGLRYFRMIWCWDALWPPPYVAITDVVDVAAGVVFVTSAHVILVTVLFTVPVTPVPITPVVVFPRCSTTLSPTVTHSTDDLWSVLGGGSNIQTRTSLGPGVQLGWGHSDELDWSIQHQIPTFYDNVTPGLYISRGHGPINQMRLPPQVCF